MLILTRRKMRIANTRTGWRIVLHQWSRIERTRHYVKILIVRRLIKHCDRREHFFLTSSSSPAPFASARPSSVAPFVSASSPTPVALPLPRAAVWLWPIALSLHGPRPSCRPRATSDNSQTLSVSPIVPCKSELAQVQHQWRSTETKKSRDALGTIPRSIRTVDMSNRSRRSKCVIVQDAARWPYSMFINKSRREIS